MHFGCSTILYDAVNCYSWEGKVNQMSTMSNVLAFPGIKKNVKWAIFEGMGAIESKHVDKIILDR